jgi:hypothetical protein
VWAISGDSKTQIGEENVSENDIYIAWTNQIRWFSWSGRVTKLEEKLDSLVILLNASNRAQVAEPVKQPSAMSTPQSNSSPSPTIDAGQNFASQNSRPIRDVNSLEIRYRINWNIRPVSRIRPSIVLDHFLAYYPWWRFFIRPWSYINKPLASQLQSRNHGIKMDSWSIWIIYIVVGINGSWNGAVRSCDVVTWHKRKR